MMCMRRMSEEGEGVGRGGGSEGGREGVRWVWGQSSRMYSCDLRGRLDVEEGYRGGREGEKLPEGRRRGRPRGGKMRTELRNGHGILNECVGCGRQSLQRSR